MVGLILSKMYPNAKMSEPNADILIENGVVTRWNTTLLGTQPTLQQLADAEIEMQTALVINGLVTALEKHYDTKAQEKRYDNRLTCTLRAGYVGPFQAEGLAFATWMDTCNAYGYQVMSDCQAQLRTIPTPSELIAELPTLVW